MFKQYELIYVVGDERDIVRVRTNYRKEDVFLYHLLNGWIDRYFYAAGLLDTTLPFEEFRRQSRINDAALAADGAPDFSERIRASLPVMRP